MDIYVMGDLHFNHANILTFGAGRPSDHEARMLKAFSELPADALLISLGDICMGQDAMAHEKIFAHLKCKTALVRGNHDHQSISWYISHGWGSVCDRMDIDMFGVRCILTHIPISDDDIPEGARNIHGHLHAREFVEEAFRATYKYDLLKHSRVAAELTDYKPVKLRHVIENPVSYRVKFLGALDNSKGTCKT